MLAVNLTFFLERNVESVLLESGPVEVDFDLTVVGQAALFVLLMVALKPLLFTPMLRLFEERERRIDGAKLEARQLDDASADALAKYEAALHEAKAAATIEREQLRNEGIKAEAEILGRVRATTAAQMETQRRQALAHLAEVRQTLHGQTRALAGEAVSKLLERKIDV